MVQASDRARTRGGETASGLQGLTRRVVILGRRSGRADVRVHRDVPAWRQPHLHARTQAQHAHTQLCGQLVAAARRAVGAAQQGDRLLAQLCADDPGVAAMPAIQALGDLGQGAETQCRRRSRQASAPRLSARPMIGACPSKRSCCPSMACSLRAPLSTRTRCSVTVTTLSLSCTARSKAVPSAVTVPCVVCTWNGCCASAATLNQAWPRSSCSCRRCASMRTWTSLPGESSTCEPSGSTSSRISPAAVRITCA